MKPTKNIQNMSNLKLVTLFEKEIIRSNTEYDEIGNRLPPCSKSKLNMMRNEIINRLNTDISNTIDDTINVAYLEYPEITSDHNPSSLIKKDNFIIRFLKKWG